jgi:hypothetical protein
VRESGDSALIREMQTEKHTQREREREGKKGRDIRREGGGERGKESNMARER